jgi:hypothetical protein
MFFRRNTMPRQIDRDDFPVLRKRQGYRAPTLTTAPKAVHEQERFAEATASILNGHEQETFRPGRWARNP